MSDDEKRLTDQLSNFREIKDVPHNGNCGYHSIYFGSQAVEKTNLLKSPKVLYLKEIHCDHAKDSSNELKE